MATIFVLGSACADPGWLQRCKVDGIDALCGVHTVAENRDLPSGRTIDLNVVVLPARSGRAAADPVVFLHGGPGVGATGMATFFARSSLRGPRDIVLVDQRGTGRSNPLDCELPTLQTRLHSMATLEIPDPAACAASLDADLGMYTTTIAMQDLDEIRQHLVAERINLVGGSYGTRAALEYMRRYPGRVRTAVLRGAYPPTEVLPLFDLDSQAALEAVLDACAADERCGPSHPNLREKVESLLLAAETAPRSIEIRVPGGGNRETVTLTREILAGSIHYMLYDARHAARLPGLIERAHAGHPAELVEAMLENQWGVETQLRAGMFYSVVCTEDAPFYDVETAVAGAAGTLLRGQMARGLARTCADWPRGSIPEDYKQPVLVNTPTLWISGAFDPVTPPRLAEQASAELPDSLHLILPHSGHASWAPGCAGELIDRFLDAGTTQGLDAACVGELRPPPFPGP